MDILCYFFYPCSTSIEYDCADGYYSTGGASVCTICQAGKACPNKDGSGIADCLPGSYALAGSTSCTDCPAGYACPTTTSDQQVACQPGSYSLGAQTSCTLCSAGRSVTFYLGYLDFTV